MVYCIAYGKRTIAMHCVSCDSWIIIAFSCVQRHKQKALYMQWMISGHSNKWIKSDNPLTVYHSQPFWRSYHSATSTWAYICKCIHNICQLENDLSRMAGISIFSFSFKDYSLIRVAWVNVYTASSMHFKVILSGITCTVHVEIEKMKQWNKKTKDNNKDKFIFIL